MAGNIGRIKFGGLLSFKLGRLNIGGMHVLIGARASACSCNVSTSSCSQLIDGV